ncbi:LMBR1-like region-containing protein, partial [Planoprotostelium fungivorum]
MIALAWVIFGLIILALVAFSFGVTKWYEDRSDSEKIPTLITVVSLSLILFCVFLIPIDIYTASSTQDGEGKVILNQGEIDRNNTFVKIGYYVLYALVLLFGFVLVPFAYFYYEEDDEDITLGAKVWAGCKYTIFTVVIVTVFLVVGIILFVVKPTEKPTTDNAKLWVQHILSNTAPEAAVSFAIASMATIGFLVWISYTAYGLAALPIELIRGRLVKAEDASNLQSDLNSTREKKRKIQSKYLGGKRISKRDESTLGLLDRKERVLSRQGERLHSQSIWYKIYAIFKPFFFIFGIIFLLFSILIWLSILLTSIDKAVNSYKLCSSSAACGFVLKNPEYFNPVDILLTKAAKFFPLDYVIVALIVIYVFLCTLSGIVKIGIRFLWIKLYELRRGASPPQGLLLAAVMLMLAILALNIEITSLAPQYTTFGTQRYNYTYVDGNNNNASQIKPCDFNSPIDACHMTQISQIVNRISIRTSFFGVIYFVATWIFLAFFVISIFIASFKRKASNFTRLAPYHLAKEPDDSEDSVSGRSFSSSMGNRQAVLLLVSLAACALAACPPSLPSGTIKWSTRSDWNQLNGDATISAGTTAVLDSSPQNSLGVIYVNGVLYILDATLSIVTQGIVVGTNGTLYIGTKDCPITKK